MSAGELPEGFLYVSRRFRTRVESRFFGAVTRDPRVMPELSRFDSAERAHFVEGKPWKVCFEELWSKPGRKPPVPPERALVKRRLRERTTAYANSRKKPHTAQAA